MDLRWQLYGPSLKVKSGAVELNGRIDISSVSNGMYVLVVGNRRSKLIVQ